MKRHISFAATPEEDFGSWVRRMEDQQKRRKAWEEEDARRRRWEDQERQKQWDAQVGDVTRYPNSTIEEEEGSDNGEAAVSDGQNQGSGWTKGFTGGQGVVLTEPTVSDGPTPVRQTSMSLDVPQESRGRGRPPPGFCVDHIGMVAGGHQPGRQNSPPNG